VRTQAARAAGQDWDYVRYPTSLRQVLWHIGVALTMRIPIGVAKDVATAYGADQVVIWTFESVEGQQVITFGTTSKDKQLAADAGNRVKRAAGWPEELCHAEPDPSAVAKAASEETANRLLILVRKYDPSVADKVEREFRTPQ
jgi:hypothetical protein